jgi:HSP20 family protein
MFGMTPWKEKRKEEYPLASMRNEFKALYDRLFGGWPMAFETYFEPEYLWNVEIEETEKEMIVRAEMPGFEPAEVEVSTRGNQLMLKAEKKHEVEEKKEGVERVEKRHRKYERIVTLPVATLPEKAEAKYLNGVLEVHLPKTEEALPKRIPVK